MQKLLSYAIGFSATALMVSGKDAYEVTLTRVNNGLPSLSSLNNQSNFTYNYNPSYVPIYDANGKLAQDALLVRAQ